ncbi:hypothetical protein C6P46_000762 [Rhodotorula mucilaginosa]|uniref:Uncharacterized protein n=1 Tax=Rhodotorula mucilaginosa TaxID=5537 RepID=A0A9P6VWB8_RHOMI|nr:hypothetical protein C6P46_000762 [Rhodotorula mucilaginosa]
MSDEVNNLRSALSSLTTRLVELTDRLAAAEADLAACRLVSEKSLREHADATLATRALATVWETRWREERRAREAAEASLRVLLAAPGPERCLLNGQSTTAGGTITTLRVAQTREKHPRTPNLHAVSCFDGGTTKSEARRTIKQDETNQSILAELVAHLRAENADQRRSFAARLEAKDAQIARLEADVSVRRDELQRLCGSIDVLLAVGATTATFADQPPAHSSHAALDPADPKPRSILDHPSVQAAARHSHSREVLAASGVSPARTMKGVELSLLPPQVAATLTLEEEVRELERQIALLESDPARVERASSAPVGAGSLHCSAGAPTAATKQARYAHARFSHARSTLEALADLQASANSTGSDPVRRPVPLRPGEMPRYSAHEVPANANESKAAEEVSRLRARVFELESECQRLSDQLVVANRDCATLRTELEEKDRTFDSLTQPVHDKLLDQKHKLHAAHTELDRLRHGLRESEAERVRLEGWLRGREAAGTLAEASIQAKARYGSSGEEGTGRPGSID